MAVSGWITCACGMDIPEYLMSGHLDPSGAPCLPPVFAVHCPMRGGEASCADAVTGRCLVCGQRDHAPMLTLA